MVMEYLIKKIFDAGLKVIATRGKNFLKNGFAFNEFLKDNGIILPLEDSYSSLFVRTLLIINDETNYSEFIPLLKLAEVFQSFEEADRKGDREIFVRELDSQLHTNQDLLALKDYDKVPDHLISIFQSTFDQCRKDSWTPSDVYSNKQLELVLETVKGLYPKQNDDKIVLEKLKKSNKDIIELIFKNIKEGKVDSGLNDLIKLKDEIWGDIDVDLKNSLLKKIAFCYLGRSDYDNAINYYEQALKIKNIAETLSVLAILYQRTNDYSKLKSCISSLEIINKDKAELIKLRLGDSTKKPEDYFNSIMNGVKTDEETFVSLLDLFSNTKEFEKAFDVSCKLIDSFDNLGYKEIASEFAVLYFQSQGIHLGIYYVSKDVREKFAVGYKYICDCSNDYRNKEIAKYKATIFCYRAIFEMWKGNFNDAFDFVNYAISFEPENYQFLKTLGAIYSDKKEYINAIEVYNKIPDGQGIDDLPLLKSLCYYSIKNTDEAKRILEEGLISVEATDIKGRILVQLLDLYFFNSDFENAERVFIENKSLLNEIDFKLINAKFLKHHGDIEKAISVFIELKNELITNDRFSHMLPDVGGELEDIGEINSAIELYEHFSTNEEDTYFLNRLYNLYARVGKIEKVIEICEAQRKNEIHEGYSAKEIAIYSNNNDHDRVIELGEQYIQRFPDNIEVRLALIHSLLKRSKKTRAKEILKYPFQIKGMDETNFRNLLDLHLRLDLLNDAFEMAYLMLAFHNNVTFNDIYLRIGFSNEKYLTSISHKTIREDSTVVYYENGIEKTITFVNREVEDYLFQFYNEVSTNESFYLNLLGEKKGSKISFERDGVLIDIEIVEVKHRYTFAFHEALRKTANDFKSESTIKSIDCSSLEFGILPDFIEEQLKYQEITRAKFIESLNLYCKGKIPLASLSKAFNKDLIELWKICTNTEEYRIFSSSGLINESNASKKFLTSTKSKDLLFDITSLLLVYKLNMLSVIKSTFNVYVLQAVIDYIEKYVSLISFLSENGSGSLIRHNGQTHYKDISAEQRQEEINEMMKFKQWIIINFKTFQPDILLKFEHQDHEKYIKVLGEATANNFLVASKSDVIFICDDFFLRNWFFLETNKSSIWSQVILEYLLSIGKLSTGEYNRLSRKMVEMNIHFTHITSDMIFDEFFDDNFILKTNNYKFLKILRGNITDNSAFLVGYVFLERLWLNPLVEIEKKRKLTFEVLYSLYINRYPLEVYNFITALTNQIFKGNYVHFEIESQLYEVSRYLKVK
jgi:tetratricopeptide (TPR) repeat protein